MWIRARMGQWTVVRHTESLIIQTHLLTTQEQTSHLLGVTSGPLANLLSQCRAKYRMHFK